MRKKSKIYLATLIGHSLLASSNQDIIVIDDQNNGVKSSIIESLGDIKEVKGITNEKGQLSFNEACVNGKTIIAEPKVLGYYNGTIDCNASKDKLVVNVSKILYVNILKLNAEKFVSDGKIGNAALAYSEYAYRLNYANPKESMLARNTAISYFASVIHTPDEITVLDTDHLTNTKVITPEFKNYLIKYQNENGIDPSGNLDMDTLRSQSDYSVGEILFKNVE